MCVIIHLPPGKSVPENKLWNAVCNNWHGWGLGLWDSDKKELSISRSIPDNSWLEEKDLEAGGNHAEFEEIMNALDNNKDKDRFLHLRHATRGRINLENCHPVCLHNTPNRQVYLMHNGSFHYGLGDSGQSTSRFAQQGYGLPSRENTVDGTGMSDTVDFCLNHLVPPLNEFVQGDYLNSLFQKHIWAPLWSKYGSQSRVLIFSNDQEPFKAGDWYEVKDADGELEYSASNNHYFDRIQRGPIFCETERARQKAEAERRALATSSQINQTSTKETSEKGAGSGEVKMISYQPGIFQLDPDVLKGLENLLQMYGDDVDADTISNLRMCSVPEFEAMIISAVKSNQITALAYLINHIIEEFGEVFDSVEPTIKKKEAAEKIVAKLKKERDEAVAELNKIKESGNDIKSERSKKVA